MRGLKGLGILLAVLAVAYVALVGITAYDRLRRSAEAEVMILRREPYTHVDTFGGSSLGGYDVRYAYTVNGRRYEAQDRRPWPDLDEREPKVCYAPGDPRDHWLVDGAYGCGDAFSSGD
jgi:hypothetical protein